MALYLLGAAFWVWAFLFYSSTSALSNPDTPVPQPHPATKPFSAEGLLQKALRIAQRTTNFSAAVDVDSIDRQMSEAKPVRGKESWRFARASATNTFVRTRFAPLPGREEIQSTNWAGGRLLMKEAANALPSNLSLPGFETANALAEMLAASPVLERKEADFWLVSAATASGAVVKTWFHESRIMPSRLERYQNGQLVFALIRTGTGRDEQLLPVRDALHFYDRGQIMMSVIRSFSNVKEKVNPAEDDSSLSSSHATKP